MSGAPSVPAYPLDEQSFRAVVPRLDGWSGRRNVPLGKHGSAGSRAEYARVIAEGEAHCRRLPRAVGKASDRVVNKLPASIGEPSSAVEEWCPTRTCCR